MQSIAFRTLCDPDAPKADVFWIHHAGGVTNTLAHRAKSIELPLRIRTPLMPAREQLVDQAFDGDLCQLAEMIAQEIVATTGSGLPLVLAGHSFGSVIAYRVACELAKQDVPVHRLLVMSFLSPDQLKGSERFDSLDDQELIQRVDEVFGGVPAAIRDDPETLRHFIPALRFDVELLAKYRHDDRTPKLGTEIMAISGTDDESLELSQVAGWKNLTRGQTRLVSMPGDHFFALERFAEVLQAATWDVV